MNKNKQHLKVDFGSILGSTSNSFNLTVQHLNKLKALPSPCAAFSQTFLVISFRWRFLGELAEKYFTISLRTPRDPKRIGHD